MGRRIVTGLTMIAFVAVSSAALAANKDRFELGEQVKNFTLKLINAENFGQPYVGIDRYYGADAKEPKKAILLSFFATYCEPCKREMPYLAALYDFYKDKGLMVMSISIDKEAEKIEEVKALAKEHHVKFPLLSDRFNIVAKRYFISKLPCVYLIDAQGKVVMVNIGYDDDVSKNLLAQIRKAIGVPTSNPVPDMLARHMTGNDASASTVDAKVEKVEQGAGGKNGGDATVAASEEGDKKVKKRKKRGRKKRRKKNK